MLRHLSHALLFMAFTLGISTASAQAEEIVVGGKNFTEQQILTSMTVQYLEHLGYDVDQRSGMGTTVLRRAQENGQVDLVLGIHRHLADQLQQGTEKLSPEQTYQRVRELDAEKGLVWLAPSDANNTYALAMREADAERLGIETISDLAAAVNDDAELTLASNATFYARDDGLRPLQETYGFRFGRANVKRMDQGLTLRALTQGEVDVAMTTATNGQIPSLPIVILEDDRQFFPNYALTPVVRQETLEANPELDEQMNSISALLDDRTMARLNARVDIEKQSAEKVAQNFLAEHELL